MPCSLLSPSTWHPHPFKANHRSQLLQLHPLLYHRAHQEPGWESCWSLEQFMKHSSLLRKLYNLG